MLMLPCEWGGYCGPRRVATWRVAYLSCVKKLAAQEPDSGVRDIPFRLCPHRKRPEAARKLTHQRTLDSNIRSN